jgi:hypothetical protein
VKDSFNKVGMGRVEQATEVGTAPARYEFQPDLEHAGYASNCGE